MSFSKVAQLAATALASKMQPLPMLLTAPVLFWWQQVNLSAGKTAYSMHHSVYHKEKMISSVLVWFRCWRASIVFVSHYQIWDHEEFSQVINLHLITMMQSGSFKHECALLDCWNMTEQMNDTNAFALPSVAESTTWHHWVVENLKSWVK